MSAPLTLTAERAFVAGTGARAESGSGVAPAGSSSGSGLGPSALGLAAEPSVAWLYRSEGFAEDLVEPGEEPPASMDSPLLRWGLPAIALFGVLGMAAAFSLV